MMFPMGRQKRLPVVWRLRAVHGIDRSVGDVEFLLLNEDTKCYDAEVENEAKQDQDVKPESQLSGEPGVALRR